MLRGAAITCGALLAWASATGAAWSAWAEPVPGPSPLNVSPTDNADAPGIAAVGGVPYVAWSESDGVNLEIRVARLNTAGTDWEEVVGGASPVNASPTQNAGAPSIAAIDGVPYVAWAENDGVNDEIRVARLNAAGTDWEEVVGGPSPINASPTRNAEAPRLTSIGGVPYVAWQEDDGANAELRVARLNAGGTDWEEVVGGANPINASPTADASLPSLTGIGGVPYVAWAENDGVNSEIRVARLNVAGTDWEELVGGANPINASPTRNASEPNLTSIGGVPYVAWQEDDGTRNQVRVARLDAGGTDWEELVGGASPINRALDQNAFDVSLAAIGGVPYVTWVEFDGTNDEARVARPNAAGTAWEEVVGGPSPVNVAPDRDASDPSLTSIGGIPYVAWLERDAGNVYQLRVTRLVPDFLPGAAAFPTGPTTALLLGELRTYGVAYPAAFELGPGAGFGTVTPLATTADGSREDTVVAEVTGLTPATQYSWRTFASDGTRRTATDQTRTFTTPAAPAVAAPPAPAPPPAPAKLVAALVTTKLTGVTGKKLPIPYFSTVDATATLVLRRKSKPVATLTGTAKPGRNTLTWTTTAKKKPLATGAYAFTLTLTSADGQIATATGTAKLTAPKPTPR